MSLLDEIAEIADKEFESWSRKELIQCAIRLLTLELFIRIQVQDGNARHIWLTSSNHPLLLKVFDETEHMSLSNDLINEVTNAYARILDIDIIGLGDIVDEIIRKDEEDLEY